MASIDNIIPNGSIVITKIGNIEAMVIGVCVRGKRNEHIEYHISRFANGDCKTEWVQCFEVDLKIDNSSPAGFVRPKNNQQLLK
jgi:hypothetical protein